MDKHKIGFFALNSRQVTMRHTGHDPAPLSKTDGERWGEEDKAAHDAQSYLCGLHHARGPASGLQACSCVVLLTGVVSCATGPGTSISRSSTIPFPSPIDIIYSEREYTGSHRRSCHNVGQPSTPPAWDSLIPVHIDEERWRDTRRVDR